jgi:biotin carboxyl carrier protein
MDRQPVTGDAAMKYVTTIGERQYTIEINRDDEITIDGVAYPIDLRAIDEATFSLLINHASHEALVESQNGEIHILLRGRLYAARVEDERASRLTRSSGGLHAGSGEVTIKSPMPGLIVSVAVSEGQAVKKGQTVIVLESMKMENELKAPRDGTIASIKVTPRQSVEQGQPLVVLT